jgi:NAD(P)-dependent dehydrogenase (short-subunit alcohol dehydrogenase family)
MPRGNAGHQRKETSIMQSTRKTWFITGASSGFGHAYASHALVRGYNVVATARTVAKLQQLVAQAPDRVLALKLDVDHSEDARAAIDAAIGRFGRIDVLINNAGYGVIGALEETPDAELRAVMETNFFGAMGVIKAALPTLRAQQFGAIVNMSSFGGQLSFAGASAYSASKFALEGASEALAQELAPFGIKVLIVEPGAFRTGFSARALRHMPVMDVYQDAVGPMRAFAHAMDNTQEGDPRKAAEAIEAALDATTTPLRLQLGADAIAAVRAHAETLLADLAGWERIANDTRLDASQEIRP